MLAYPFEEKRLLAWNDAVIVQPKLDGERCRMFIDIEPILVSSTGELQNFAVPSLVEAGRILFLQTGRRYELDGELYIHGEDFNEIHSIVSRTTHLHPMEHKMEFHIFDLVDENTSQILRLRQLIQLAELFPPNFKLVKSTAAETLVDVRSIFNQYVNEGYEGIVVRNIDAPYIRRRSPFVMKFKPKRSDVYNIAGWVEGKGKYAGTIGTILCVDDTQMTFEVGSFSVNDEDRKLLWDMRETLTQFACKVNYQHKWPSGAPKSAVFVTLVDRIGVVEDVNPLI